MGKGKTYTAARQAKVVLELLREEQALAQVAAQHDVHPNQLRRWKQMALEGLPILFGNGDRRQFQEQFEHEQRWEQLYAEIGRLTAQLACWEKAGVDEIPL